MAEQAKVDATNKLYDKYKPKWERCRAVCEGQDAVHAKGETFLPKLTDQSVNEYNAYRTRAGFYNATSRTKDGFLGMIFRKPPQRAIPAAIEKFMTDVDMAGTTLEAFAREVTDEVLQVGRIGILVDHPQVETVSPITRAAAEQRGLRPMFKLYDTEDIIDWRYGRVNNRTVLTQVRLKECVSEPDGEFGNSEIDQIRVLDLDGGAYRQRTYRKATEGPEKGNWILFAEFYPLMNGGRLDFIPFAMLGTDGMDDDLDEPPLLDLVDVNLSHYRTNADYEHGCHFTGLPTLFLSGFSPDEKGEMPSFYIGSQAAIVASHPDAKGQFIEFTGQGLTAIKDNLDRKEQQMAILGARMLFAEKRQVEAAETAAIHRAGENSVLASIAGGISQGLEWALGVFAKWAGASGTITYQLNRDFNPAMMNAQQLTALVLAVQKGEMSSQELFELLQRADMIDPEKTFEEHQAQVDAQAPPAPVIPANNNPAVAA